MQITKVDQLRDVVQRQVRDVEITDVHTHLYAENFGDLLLWGVDELLTYHYLIAEFFRYSDMDYGAFFQLTKKEQADRIWQTLFVDRSPVSEAQRGVLTVFKELGLDVSSRDLNAYREYVGSFSTAEYIDRVLEVSRVKEVVMTNDPFDDQERQIWETAGNKDSRFKGVLRVDPLLNSYPEACGTLQAWGYEVTPDLDTHSVREIRRFLTEWAQRMDALYLAVSLPPTFVVPEHSMRSRIVEECVLPVCRELNIPFAMMIGVKKRVNYKLELAGDSVGKADIRVLEYLCSTYPDNKFLVTMLARENQHELAVTARKFRNLFVFGCWWFLNNPSIIEETTRVRLELLGLSFAPQHSDARVLDQLVYKWNHSRSIIADVLTEKYTDLFQTGWRPTEAEIRRDVEALFGGNFWTFLRK